MSLCGNTSHQTGAALGDIAMDTDEYYFVDSAAGLDHNEDEADYDIIDRAEVGPDKKLNNLNSLSLLPVVKDPRPSAELGSSMSDSLGEARIAQSRVDLRDSGNLKLIRKTIAAPCYRTAPPRNACNRNPESPSATGSSLCSSELGATYPGGCSDVPGALDTLPPLLAGYRPKRSNNRGVETRRLYPARPGDLLNMASNGRSPSPSDPATDSYHTPVPDSNRDRYLHATTVKVKGPTTAPTKEEPQPKSPQFLFPLIANLSVRTREAPSVPAPAPLQSKQQATQQSLDEPYPSGHPREGRSIGSRRVIQQSLLRRQITARLQQTGEGFSL
jgi:hypothetical protein